MVLQQRVQLEEFILCPINQHLEHGSARITLEPKVYEVLCYLIKHQHRFVSLEELHQQIWAGRVVSDTAVRRSVSKLRAAFNDQQDPPRFIQSAAKRGYRWLVAPQFIDTDIATSLSELPTSATIVAAPITVKTESLAPKVHHQTESHPTNEKTKPLFKKVLLFFPILLLLPLCWFFWQQQPYWHLEPPLPVLEGEKLSMDISPDLNTIIFTSNAANHIGQEIYSYNFATGVLQQLTSGDNQIMHAAFAKDGKSLFYHNFKNNSYEFFQHDLTANGQLADQPKLLLSGYDVMLDIQPQPDLQTVLLNLGSKQGQGQQSQIQRLDLSTGALTAVTSSMIAGVHDLIFAVSPDQRRLVFQRRIPGQPSMLIEQDLMNGAILKQMLYPARIFDLHWSSAEELLVLDETALVRFNLTTQTRQELHNNALLGSTTEQGLSRTMLQRNEQEWLMFKHAGDLSKHRHQQGKVGAFHERTLIHSIDHTRNIYFTQQPQQYFVHLQRDDLQQFSWQHADGKQEQLFEIKGQKLVFQQQHSTGDLLLFLLDGKPHLFNLNSRHLTPLNMAGNQWQSAYFMPNGEDILLTSKTHGEYQSFLYQTATGQSQALYHGYRLVIPYSPEQYIALREDLTFVLIKNGIETALNAKINPPYPGSVHLRQHELFWGETDLKTTRICRYQLIQQQQHCWQHDRRQLLQRFDISADGEFWLLRHVASIDTKIHPINTNLK